MDFFDDLTALDYVEMLGSTVLASKALGVSQSSCSRRYRNLSDNLGLDFLRGDHGYSASSNLDLLDHYRQAAQKLRVRKSSPRIALGWQLGDNELCFSKLNSKLLPVRPMAFAESLELLERRLVDLSILGLLELESLLGRSVSSLRSQRISLGANLCCIPMFVFDYNLVSRFDHPLQSEEVLTPSKISEFPSPAVPLAFAPVLMNALNSHGLGTCCQVGSNYSEAAWEGFAGDGLGLSYAAPHSLSRLFDRYNLKPLDYRLDISECIGVVGHRDVLWDGNFSRLYSFISSSVFQSVKHVFSRIRWLS